VSLDPELVSGSGKIFYSPSGMEGQQGLVV
jgi:hypothetical protein